MGFLQKGLKKIFPGSTKAIANEAVTEEASKIAGQMVQTSVEKIKAQLGYGRGGTGGGEKYRGGLSGSGSGLFLQHSTARQNARMASFDSLQARAVINRFATIVAGTGLTLEATPMADILGITPQESERWAQDVESRFHIFCSSKKQCRSGSMNFYQAQEFWQLSRHRDNDIFVRLYYSRDKRLVNPLQFEFIDPDQIRGQATTSTYGFNKQDDGIVRDANGVPIGYKVWLQNDKKPGEFKAVTIPAETPLGRKLMLHGFVAEFAGQGRGFSRLLHALQEFQNLTDFSLSQVLKAISQSQIALYVKPAKDADASNPWEGLSSDVAGPISEVLTDSAPTELTGPGVEICELPAVNTDKPGQTILATLQAGEDLGILEKAPADKFSEFVDSFVTYLAASLDMPIEILTMKFGQNYSASRATLLLFWQIAMKERQEMVVEFLAPVYEQFLSEEIAAGRIKAPGWSNPVLRRAWLSANFIGSAMPNIDPLKAAKAVTEQLKTGSTNLRIAAREASNTKFSDNAAKNAVDVEKLVPMPFSSDNNNSTTDNSGDTVNAN
jgi:lambda family phage portal protein